METFNHTHFIKMPWKNGGGETLEIFRIPGPAPSTFSFRLSLAKVETSGPFSSFPGIERTLILLSGEGFTLSFSDKIYEMKESLIPFHFSGETPITCQLIQGPCRDFNIMTDRRFGKSTISIICPPKEEVFTLTAECDFKFIYDIEKRTLYKLERNESFNMKLNAREAAVIVDLNIYA